MDTRSRALTSVLFAIAIGTLPSTASAIAIYSYQGVPLSSVGVFHESGDRVVGELTFAEPLAPNLVSADMTSLLLDFHFNDGAFDWTLKDYARATLSTDEHGAIVGPYYVSMGMLFGVIVRVTESGIESIYSPGGPCVPGICYRDPSSAGPGQWTQVPEPMSGMLLASGLVALASRSRRA